MQAIRINYKKNKQMNYWLIDFVNDKRKNKICLFLSLLRCFMFYKVLCLIALLALSACGGGGGGGADSSVTGIKPPTGVSTVSAN